MANCCSSSGCTVTHPTKNRCPANGHEYSEVSATTITHHLKESWSWMKTANRYFFCDDPSCEVVYFGDDGSTIPKSKLRTSVGIKEASDDALLCYCYGVSRKDFAATPATRDFVVAQTKAGSCSCYTSNPSGRCCLKDFPKLSG